MVDRSAAHPALIRTGSYAPHRPNSVAKGLRTETLAADIVGSVRERQQELASVEETLTKMERGPPVWRHRDIAKMNSLQKRRMDLRNGITRDVKDLEKFIELTN
eukprot:s446_g3.t1